MPTFLDDLPEVFVSNTAISALVHQAVKDGNLRKLGSRLYTKDSSSPPEDIPCNPGDIQTLNSFL